MWWVVGGSAVLSGVFGGFRHGWGGLGEGIAILVATIVIMTIGTFADLYKDKKFVGLQSLIKEENIAVVRGKFGSTQSISVWDIVVGDIIILQAGARVPADCLVIEAADLETEEKGQKHKKTTADAEDSNPFLYADSLITKGQCKAVVCSIGSMSSRGTVSEKLDTDIDTRLQQKLKNLEGYFTLYSILAAALIFILMTVMIVWEVVGRDKSADAPGILNIVLSKLTNQINFIVVLIVVSIPEGLPLTIGVSLAFSVGKMY